MGTGRNRWSVPPVPFGGWFGYPAAFNASVLGRCLAAADLTPGATVVDPFCGSAALVSAATARGLRAVGLEAHPLVARLAGLKFTGRRDTSVLRADAERIVAGLTTGDSINGEHELLRRCFDTETLGLLVALRQRIAGSQSKWRGHLELALIAGLRDHACVRVGWAYPQPAQVRTPKSVHPAGAFVARIESMADEMDALPASWATLGRVAARDARSPFAWRGLIGNSEADAAITSPPYFNNYDYLDAIRLEMLFSNPTNPDALLHAQGRMLRASTRYGRSGEALAAQHRLSQWPRTAAACRALSGALRHQRLTRSGKAYDRVLPQYLLDMGLAFERLARVVRPDAAVVVVVGDSAPYGVRVDTPQLLSRLAEESGFRCEGSELLRARGGRWRGAGQRHQLDLSERLVLLRRAEPVRRRLARPAAEHPAVGGERRALATPPASLALATPPPDMR